MVNEGTQQPVALVLIEPATASSAATQSPFEKESRQTVPLTLGLWHLG